MRGLVLRLFLLPVMVIRLVGRVLGRVVGRVLAPFAARVDSSDGLSNLLNAFSSSMATQRGLLLMVGTGILIVSLVVHGIVLVLLVTTDSFDRNLYWLCLPVTLLHVGILVGFTGVMLATPLGQGYKDES